MYVQDKTVEKMQSIIYEILCEIDSYCSKEGIKYFLSGGTCLGAVRHKGFIPWDDDGDIMMPRDDYEKFIQHFGTKTTSRFRICTLDNDKKCNLPYARVWDPNTRIIHKTVYGPDMGVSVDVFPIDGVSDVLWKRKVFFGTLKVLDNVCSEATRRKYLPEHRFVVMRKIVGRIARLFGVHFFASLMNSLAKAHDYNTSRYVACSLPAHYGERETIDKIYMSDPVCMDFKDSKFSIPSGYDRYLTNLYGKDYMVVPDGPKETTHLDVWEVQFDVGQ